MPHAILRRRRSAPLGLARLAWGVVLAVATGCATTSRAPTPGFDGPRPDGALEVRLIFGEGADLDLFVSDPRQEALYFGNNPSVGGGVLDVDRRCDAAVPRVEVARFENARPGRYRVGVSYDRACGFRSERMAFEIRVEADGLRLERSGEVDPSEFEHIVLEFDLGDAPVAPTAQP